jgi:hypothetical protein
MSFVEIGNGVDDDSWLHHLRNGDHSRWMATAIKDDELAAEVAEASGRPTSRRRKAASAWAAPSRNATPPRVTRYRIAKIGPHRRSASVQVREHINDMLLR